MFSPEGIQNYLTKMLLKHAKNYYRGIKVDSICRNKFYNEYKYEDYMKEKGSKIFWKRVKIIMQTNRAKTVFFYTTFSAKNFAERRM